MTAIVLLEILKAFIEDEVKGLALSAQEHSEENQGILKVYIMSPPNQEDETEHIPYLLLQFMKSIDNQQEGKSMESFCMVKIVTVIKAKNGTEGIFHVLNVLTRIRIALLKDGIIGKQFVNIPPLEIIVPSNSTAPYYFGEMVTVWKMPSIESEVVKVWQ